MDRTTLHNYAYVARHVPRSLRNEALSWEHHKKVAKLKDEAEKARWLTLAADRQARRPADSSLRRFARSIEAGRLLTPRAKWNRTTPTGHRKRPPLREPHRRVLRAAARRAAGSTSADEHKRAALKRDLQPIIDIYTAL